MTIQQPVVTVIIAGRQVSEVSEVSVSAGFDQANAQATLICASRPSWAEEGAAVEVWAGTQGNANRRIFLGELSGLAWEYADTKVSLDARDLLARCRLPWGGADRTYTNQDDAAIVQNLVEAMGIPSSITHIESSSWTMAVVQDIVLKEGDAAFTLISQIDDLAGYKTYTTADGIIMRTRVSGAPGSGAALTFERGVSILARPRHTRTRDGIINRAIVTGLTYEGLRVGGPGVGEASASNPYIPDPPGFVTETVQSDLVEDDARALAIAQRIVADKNRRPEAIEWSVPFEPRVQPGMTVTVVHPEIEVGSANVFVAHLEHRISSSGATTAIRTTGAALAGYAGQPPIASFAVQTFLEGNDTGSGVAGVIVVVADGSQSYDPDGTIARYAWTASGTGATPSPTTGDCAIFRCTVSSAATAITIGLTVTDNDGLTGATALVTPLTTTPLLVEDLYLAYGDVACSSDGEQTWRTATPASGSASCLAAIAPAWGQAWGASTGHIYATFDKLTTALTDLGQPHAVACTAIWAHEADAARLWAGFADGDVWQGTVDATAKTATWARRGAVPGGSIVELRESYGTPGELRATAGVGYYASTDSGATWALQHTFDTAWRMAAGFDTNLASGLNDAAPLYAEAGSPPTVPGGVTHLRGLTFGWRTKALYAADDAAGLYTTDDTLAALTRHADSAPAGVNHMIRSGNLDGVIYLACGDGTGDNGAVKWLPDVAAPFFIRRTGSAACTMVGYGPAHLPIVSGPYTILMLPSGATGAADNLFVTTDGGVTWIGKALPEANKRDWVTVKAHSVDSRKLLLFRADTTVFTGGDNALYYSDDGGDTWATVYSSITSDEQWNARVFWSLTQANAWVGNRNLGYSSGAAYIQKGTLDSYTETSALSVSVTAQPGLHGEIIYQDHTGAQRYLDSGGGDHAGPGGVALPRGFFFTQRLGGRRAAQVREHDEATIKITTDYTADAWVDIPGSAARGSLAVLADGTICGGRPTTGGIVEVADAWGAATVMGEVAFHGFRVTSLVADAQSQTLAAAVVGEGSGAAPAVRDAAGVWSLRPRPPLATALADAIEIVVRR